MKIEKKRMIIISFAMLAVLLCILLLVKGKGQSSSSKENSSTWISYQLIVNENANEKDMEHDIKILKERFSRFFEKDEYSLKKEENHNYIFNFNQESLTNSSTTEEAMGFLLQRGDLLLGFTDKVYQDLVDLQPEDYLEIKWGDGIPENIMYYEKEEDSAPMSYFSFELSDETSKIIQSHKEFLENNQMNIRVNDKVEGYHSNHSYVTMYCLFADEKNPNLYYILYDKEEAVFAGHEKLFQYMLSHEYMSYPLDYCLNNEMNIQWQKTQETDYPGIYQCNVDDYQSDYYTLIYESYSRLASDELQNLERIIKSRLDLRGEKYAYGLDTGGKLYIRTSAEKLNDWYIYNLTNLYGSGIMTLTNGIYDVTLTGNEFLEYDSNLEKLILYQGDSNDLSIFTEDDTIYFLVRDLPVAYGKMKDCSKVDTLVFDQFCFHEDGNPGQEEQWLMEYFANIYNGDKEDESSTKMNLYEYYYCGENGERDFKETKHFNLTESIYYDEDILQNKIQSICPQATVRADITRTSITIKIHQEPEKGFVKKSLDMVKEMIKALDFQHSLYSQLEIYLYDCKGTERADLYFHREIPLTYTDEDESSHKEKETSLWGFYFANGRSKEYIGELREYLKEDNYYEQYLSKEDYATGWGIGEE